MQNPHDFLIFQGIFLRELRCFWEMITGNLKGHQTGSGFA